MHWRWSRRWPSSTGCWTELDPEEPFPASVLGAPRGRQGSPRKRVVLPDGWLEDTDGRGVVVREDADETTGG